MKYYKSVSDVLTDPSDSNKLWVGGAVGLFSFDKQSGKFTLHKNADIRPDLVLKPSIRHFEWQNDTEIRVSYFNSAVEEHAGTAVYNTVEDQWYNVPTGSTVPPRILGFARKSETEYWLAARRAGFGILNTENNIFQALETDPEKEKTVQGGPIRKVYTGRHGSVWVLGDKGISYYDPLADVFTKYELDFQIPKFGRTTSFLTKGDKV